MIRIILFLLPKRFDAIALFSKVYAREGASEQLLKHEAVHVKQQRENPVMFYFVYLFNRTLRMHYEAEAYAASVRYGMTIYDASMSLALYYRLDISTSEAKKIIESYL